MIFLFFSFWSLIFFSEESMSLIMDIKEDETLYTADFHIGTNTNCSKYWMIAGHGQSFSFRQCIECFCHHWQTWINILHPYHLKLKIANIGLLALQNRPFVPNINGNTIGL